MSSVCLFSFTNLFLRLIYSRREPVAGEFSKMAVSTRRFDESQYRVQGPLQGHRGVVYTGRYFQPVEVIIISFMDPWQTHVPFLPLLYTRLTPALTAGSGKSVLWFVVPGLVIYSDSIMAQLRNNRRHHGTTQGRICDHSLFLLRFSRQRQAKLPQPSPFHHFAALHSV